MLNNEDYKRAWYILEQREQIERVKIESWENDREQIYLARSTELPGYRKGERRYLETESAVQCVSTIKIETRDN